jgi:hypothetical protein
LSCTKYLSALICLIFTLALGYKTIHSQTILEGKLIDEISLKPIDNADVKIIDLKKNTLTDSSGNFSFEGINYGSHKIFFNAEGYRSKTINVFFDSLFSGNNFLVKLQPLEGFTDTIDVSSLFFKKNEDIHTANTYAKYEELRKTPDTVEDIIKYFQSTAGVSFANDNDNDIIVRGGSPIENLTMIDNVEVLNPNHYGPPGSTSGALSFINLKLVDEVNFYSGGFPVKYGNRISSVMDIKLKDGNEERHWKDLNISFSGFGGFFEGPITKNFSYMFSIRKSYFELLRKDLNFSYLPNYWDFNLKLNYNINKTDKISLIGLFAIDKANKYDKETDSVYTSSNPVDLKLLVAGVNYVQNRKSGIFSFTISDNYSFYKAALYGFNLKIKDNQFNLRSDYKTPVSNDFKIDLTAEGRYVFSYYDVFSNDDLTPTGFFVPPVSYNKSLSAFRFGLAANLIGDIVNHKINFNAGFRIDYLDLMKNGFSISPRAGISYRFLPLTTLNLNVGLYSQQPEFLWLLSGSNSKTLFNINAKEAILGIEHFFAYDIRANIEGYVKYYSDYPISVYDPYYIFINISGIYPNFLGDAVSEGKGYFAGLDFTLQKKNPGPGFYGTLNVSYNKSAFKATLGGYQPSGFDYGKQVTLISGYRLKSNFIFGFRLKYSDGRPYTPYDIERSQIIGSGSFDMSQYNKARMPYYLRLDARIDKDINIGKTELIVYVEVWNLLDRKNVYEYSWSGINVETIHHWSRVPILGLSFQF